MQHVDQFAASGPPTCRKIGHAARSDMFGGRKEKGGKAAPSDISTGKRGTNAVPVPVPVPSACLRYEKGKRGKQLHRFVDEKEGKQLHLHDLPVDEKEGNYILSAAARLRRPVGRARFCR